MENLILDAIKNVYTHKCNNKENPTSICITHVHLDRLDEYIYIHVYIYINMHIYMHIYAYIIYIYVYLNAYISVCMHILIYIHMYA